MAAYESLKAVLITELGTRMTYKVEYGKMVLALVQTESSAKLLEEDRGTFGRTKEQNGVDLRNVHTLVEKVYDEEIVDCSSLKLLLDEGPMVVVVVTRKHIRMQSGKRELGVHESCVLLVYTEAKRTDLVESAVSNILLHLLQDETCTEIVPGVDTRQLGDVVAVAAPFHFRQIHIIRDAIIMERSKQSGIQGSWKTYFGRDMSVEENRDILLFVCTFGRCCKTKQNVGLEVSNQFDVGWSHDVMNLVHNHIVVEVLSKLQTVQSVAQCVLACKDMLIA